MANINCKICNKEYDESEASCPNCGYKTPKNSNSNNKILIIGGGAIVFVIIIILLISGNGNSIYCSLKDGNETDSIKLVFDGNKISKATRTSSIIADSEEEANQYYEQAKRRADNKESKVKYSYSKDGLKVTLSGTTNYENLEELDLDKLAEFDSKEELIKEIEKEGYTCKK